MFFSLIIVRADEGAKPCFYWKREAVKDWKRKDSKKILELGFCFT